MSLWAAKSKTMINAYCDGGGNNKTNTGFYGSFYVEDQEMVRYPVGCREYAGLKTVNEAEYQTLILLLIWLYEHNITDEVLIHSDSMLVVQQMNKEWRVNSNSMKRLNNIAMTLLIRLPNVKIEWVSRKVIVKVLGH